MDGNISILLSSGMWIMAVSVGVVILLVACGVLSYCKNRIKAVTGDSADCASLAAKKERLQADVQKLEEWITEHQNDLLKIEAERKKQEEIRLELEELQDGLADLRHEKNQLESNKEILHSVVQSLRHEQAHYEQKNNELSALQNELARVQTELQQGNAKLAACVDAEIKHSKLSMQHALLEEQIAKAIFEKTNTEAAIQEINVKIGLLRKVLQEHEEKIKHNKNLETAQAELKANISGLENKKFQLDDEILKLEKTCASRKKNLESLNEKYEQTHDEMQARQSALSKLMLDSEDQEKRIKILEAAQFDLKVNIGNLESRKSQLSDEIKKCEGECVSCGKELDTLTAKCKQMHDDMQSKQSVLLHLEEKRKAQDAQIQIKDAALRSKEAEYAVLEEKIRDQRNALGLNGEEPEGAYADLVDKRPECLNGLDKVRSEEINETEMLENLCAALEKEGHYFSRRIINAFHTSLKCQDVNPLTVLAGVSGTGKTLLPNKYADFMGIHKLVMAVQPRWDSPQDLFGFYNYLEKKYKAKDLARLLVHMDPYNEHGLKDRRKDMQDRLALVLLDEMNLARTEYYFSEFLSRLELRQLVDPNKRQPAELELDTGPGVSRRIWVPKNVFFVGTMNEDESTQTLSDKVLDRSNVLRFGKPAAREEAHHNDKQNSENSGTDAYLQVKTWKSWHKEPNISSSVYKDVTGWINALNESMDKIGRPFGFRVQNAMQTYVANYPDMGVDGRHKLAFADQIEQKILPKLRGLDMEGKGLEVLQTVQGLIENTGDEALSTAFDSALHETSTGMFQWRGVTRSVDAES